MDEDLATEVNPFKEAERIIKYEAKQVVKSRKERTSSEVDTGEREVKMMLDIKNAQK